MNFTLSYNEWRTEILCHSDNVRATLWTLYYGNYTVKDTPCCTVRVTLRVLQYESYTQVHCETYTVSYAIRYNASVTL